MITATILALIWNYRKKIPNYVTVALAVGLIIGCTVLFPKRPKRIVDLADGTRIKIYWKTTGLMDAGTVFDVYQPNSMFPFIKSKIGRAQNMSVDYLNLYPEFELQLLDHQLVVAQGVTSDTLQIQ